MKKRFLTLVLLVSTYGLSAQNFRLGGGIDVGIPVNNLNGSSVGAGIDLMGLFELSEPLGISVDVGYTSLFAKGNNDNLNLVPIRAGIRFNATPEIYLGGKAGVGLLFNDGNDVTTTAYSFGAGYKMDSKLDIGLSYDGFSKNGSFGLLNLRLGYFFH